MVFLFFWKTVIVPTCGIVMVIKWDNTWKRSGTLYDSIYKPLKYAVFQIHRIVLGRLYKGNFIMFF